MRVKTYHIDNAGNETFQSACDHSNCFPDDAEEAALALDQLRHTGRYWTGGGAAPLFLLMRVE